MKNQKPILLVEDDRVDAMTVKRSLKEIKVTNPLEIANNGVEALAYLNDETNARPCLILLDINMPKMNGLEFLEAIKADENHRQLPVVILTTSKEDQDIFRSYQLSVAGYVVKPVDYLQFVEAVKTLQLYWSLNELPV